MGAREVARVGGVIGGCVARAADALSAFGCAGGLRARREARSFDCARIRGTKCCVLESSHESAGILAIGRAVGASRPRNNQTARLRQHGTPDKSGSLNHAVATKYANSIEQADPIKHAKPAGQERASAAVQHEPSAPSDGVRERDIDRSKSSPRSSTRGHLPRETLRRLVERDGPCCSFVGDDGTRCASRAFLEIDHRQPWARGGPDTFENLRWLCRAHNQLMAERDFGKPHVQRAIAERRDRQAARCCDQEEKRLIRD